MAYSLPGSSVQGFLQARTLKWVTIPFYRGSSQPRNWTQVCCIAGRFFTDWAMQETWVWFLSREDPLGNDNLLQYSCLENSKDRGAWQATVHRVTIVRHDLALSHLFFLIFKYIYFIYFLFYIIYIIYVYVIFNSQLSLFSTLINIILALDKSKKVISILLII